MFMHVVNVSMNSRPNECGCKIAGLEGLHEVIEVHVISKEGEGEQGD